MKRIVIIGGGIGGLSTAYFIKELAPPDVLKDIEVTLIEKSGRLGGNILTEETDGFLVEGGPDCFLSEKPWAMALCRRLGLASRLLATNEGQKTYVLSGGRLHRLPEGVILMVPTKMLPLITSSLITFRGKMRMAMELFVPRRKVKADESLAEFVRRRLGREALEKIAEPLVAGVHAGDAETMSIESSFPRFVELEREHGSLIRGMIKRMGAARRARKKEAREDTGERVTMFMTLKGGLKELVDVLVARIEDMGGASVITGKEVTGVVKKGAGYEVLMDGGSFVNADSLIIATPAYSASALVGGLDRALAELLLTIPYVSTATVSIAFRKADVRHPLDGFGFVVPRTEKRRIMAATWTSQKWAGRAPLDRVLIRCFLGGAAGGALLALGDEEMTGIVREELKDIMGIDAEPVLSRVFRWTDAMPQYTIGHRERVDEIERVCASHPGLYLTGSAYRGIGISDTVREAEETARKVLDGLTSSPGAKGG